LGDELGLEGFGQVDLEELHVQVQAEIGAGGTTAEQAGAIDAGGASTGATKKGNGLHRVGEVPMFSTDALCRRATALQSTAHASNDFVGLNPVDAESLGLSDGVTARIRQGQGTAELNVMISDRVPVGAAWVRTATCRTIELGSATGPVQVEVLG